jgi:hypothetical protein
MDLATAAKVEAIMREVEGRLDESIAIVMDNCDHDEFHRFRRLVGKLMGTIFLDVLQPLYETYPEMTPESLRKL